VDIIHRPVFYLKQNASETVSCVFSWRPIDGDSPVPETETSSVGPEWVPPEYAEPSLRVVILNK
jgi:hypothetical protein